MVAYIKSDLEFILKQIKISEAHAGGQPLFGPGGLIPTYNLSWGLRTVDGTYNNLLPGREHWGAADRPFPEPLGTSYRNVTVMMDPDGPGPAPKMPITMSYTPGRDVDGPGTFAKPGDIIDPAIRTISNLIVDQTLANPAAILLALQRAGSTGDVMVITATIQAAFEPLEPLFEAVTAANVANAAAQAAAAANPGDPALALAAAATAQTLANAQTALANARETLDGLLTANGITMDGDNVSLPNIAPDEGLSAPFNSWFTLFGQFFDHGLDLVNKGGSGTVMIPLQPDDPLYSTAPGALNFMVLTRATVTPGPDGIVGDNPATPGINEGADDGRPVNTTTSFVDQNQTYTSHASHQVFVRQYELNAAGKPVATGRLIEGSAGGMATWADVKAQALMLGIKLTDLDVGNVPLLRTDQYGRFIPNADGYAQVIIGLGPDGIPNTADDVVVSGTPNAPVDLIAVGAVRTGHAFLADIAHTAAPDGLEDGDTEIGGNIPVDGEYDDELLDAHYIAGDGRVNENIGLTAVHHVFHSEHNRLVEHTKDVTIADAQEILAAGGTQAEAVAFLNEWLAVDVTEVPDSPAEVSALVWDGERLFQAAKFGTEMQYQHLVFEEFARKIQPNINVFLVPDGYDATIDPTIVAEFAHVVYRFGHSMLGEGIDRFDPGFNADHISLIEGFLNPLQFKNNGTNSAVDADISAGAIIRGMTRQEGQHIDEFVTSALRNNLLGLPLDLATINIARGRDTGVPSLNAARREFYEVTNNAAELKPYESWIDFAGNLKNEASIINFVAAYGTHQLITSQTTIEGKRDAAMTIITGIPVGGLAVPADAAAFLNGTGIYASTLGGLEHVDLWIGGLAEKTMPFGGMLGSTFNFVFEVQMEALQSGDRFYYLQRLDGLHLFGEMEGNSFAAMIMRNTDATHLPSDVFSAPGLILEVDASKQFNDLDGDGVLESSDPVGGGLLTPLVVRGVNDLRYNGGEHVVLGGTNAANKLTAGIGDDTLYGDGGNDRLEGGYGNDIINGGDGDDIITDIGGDENIKGGDGNDVIHAGPGLDLVLAGRGNDFVVLGTDMGSEVFAGEGDDFILGNKNAERILGNEGNDWIETGTFDGAPGDNFDEIFAADSIDGNDVFLGDGGFDEFIGEGGDDIMVGSLGRGKMAGMSGFDWATYKDMAQGVNADLSTPIIFDESPVLPVNAALDEYASMEGLSGTRFDDVLSGTNEDATTRLPLSQGGSNGMLGSFLDAQGISLISGLQGVLGAGVNFFSAGDIILGGDGSDLIRGNAGDDIIDGDKWLNVQIGVYSGMNGTGNLLRTVDSMRDIMNEMFAGTINPGQLKIVRTIETANGAGDVDIAAFSGNFADYDITYNADGSLTIAHARGTLLDGTDRVSNIERLRFADMEVVVNKPATGQPVISDVTPTEGQQLTLNTAGITDGNGLGAFAYQWQSSTDGLVWSNIAGATAATFTPDDDPLTAFGDQAGLQLRVRVSFTDGAGYAETVVSNATAPTGVNWDGLPYVPLLFNGNNTFNGTAGNDIADGVNQGTIFGFPINNTGNDTLNGAAGDDDLEGAGGNDLLTGGAGNDLLFGGSGTDTAAYSGPHANYGFALVGGNLQVTDTTGVDGVDILNGVDVLRFGAQNLALVQGTDGNNGAVNGTAGADLVLGHGGNDVIDAGTGNDVVKGGAGNDVINWFANGSGDTDGRDLIDGGSGEDTYDVEGRAGVAETFTVFSRAAAITAGITDLAAATEIVITRTVAGVRTVIAELDNIEEIMIGTRNVDVPGGPAGGGAGGNPADSVVIVGNFAGTSLALDTITIHSGSGDDVIDISALQSSHRIVFVSGGGTDTLIGTLRPEDVIQLPFGASVADYQSSVGPNGEKILTNGTHTISFGSDGLPDVRTASAPPPEVPVDLAEGTHYFGATMQPTDELNGGSGHDAVVLQGNYQGFVLGAGSLVDVETLALLSGGDTRFGDLGGNSYSYDLTTVDANVASGAHLLVNGSTLGDGESLRFDGSAETDGTFTIYGGTSADELVGGGRDDLLIGLGGDDRIDAGLGRDYVDGGAGDDNIRGGGGTDLLVGGAGSDQLFGQDDDDEIHGQDGLDYLEGGNGNDRLYGGVGVDVLVAGAGNDQLYGQEDSDELHGGAGADYFDGGSGDDRMYGDAGIDLMLGGAGNDQLYGLDDDDLLSSDDGDDYLDGGSGNDLLYGGVGADVLVGGTGHDQLYGQDGSDQLSGDAGNDYLVGGAGQDVIFGGTEVDLLLGGSANDQLYGEEGDDWIGGEEGDDYLNGGGGNDLLYGGLGADVLAGADGNDQLYGETGNDQLYGDAGDDYLVGGAGQDLIFGGSGTDYIIGGEGADTLSGHEGADVFVFQAGDSLPGMMDLISDFSSAAGDKIDLSSIDADTATTGQQAFTFLGTGAFTNQAGQLRYELVDGQARVSADVNGDGVADLAFLVNGTELSASDFIGVAAAPIGLSPLTPDFLV